MARGKDGTIRAFSAVCQHRGMQVVDDAGTCTKFTCPYHQWSYDLTGRLLGAPAMERTAGFDKKDYPLPPLAVELWQGFVFVHFDLDAPPLAPTLASYEPYIEHYELARRRLPGHVHAHRPAVELEGDVRELQRRLPRQQAAPHHPGLLSQRAGRLPGRVGAEVERHLPHQRLRPHRWRVQRDDQGAHAGLSEADRGGALAVDLRPAATLAVLRDRPRPGLLLHRPPQDAPTPSTWRSGTCSIPAPSSTRCSTTCCR